jgi:hypothetical protein
MISKESRREAPRLGRGVQGACQPGEGALRHSGELPFPDASQTSGAPGGHTAVGTGVPQ